MTNKKYVIIGISIALLIAVLFLPSCTAVYYDFTPATPPPSEQASHTTNWNISGETVFFDDENAYLSAKPHTVTSPGWVEFIVSPKIYTGDIDVCWGFAEPTVKPTKAEYYAPYWNNWTTTHSMMFENVQSYSPTNSAPDFGEDNEYNIYHYTVTYQRCIDYNEDNFECNEYETVTSTIYCYDATPFPPTIGQDCTVTWIEEHSEIIPYQDVSGAFESAKHDYEGMNTWYYKKNFHVVAGETYKLRMWVDMPISTDLTSGKYFWAVKPSGETIKQAISNGHFYALDPWYSSSWGKRKQWVVTNVNITTLTNFPAYINVTKESEMQADYDDVVFTDSNSVLIPFELENYTTSFADYWVNVTIPGSSSVTGWMYYSNPGATSQENMEGVWDSSYVMVHHLQNMTDSTSYSNDGANFGATYNQSGRIDGAYDFNGTSDYINCDNDPSLNFVSEDFTIEAWIYTTPAADPQRLFERGRYQVDGYSVYVRATAVNFNTFQLGGNQQTSATPVVANSWTHVVVVRSGAGAKIYKNAVDSTSVFGAHSDPTTSTKDALIGVDSAFLAPYHFNGTIDEVRISSTARSADWINQSYEMVVNQSTWVTWVSGEEAPYYMFGVAVDPVVFKKSKEFDNFTGNESWDNFTSMVETMYTDVWGNVFYLFIFGIPILMLWLRQENIILPIVMGLIVGVAGFSLLPPEYRVVSITFLGLSFAAIAFTIFKSRR